MQDKALLDDGLHYEERIARKGAIATRAENWHDLFNALIWLRYPSLKRALNARQMDEIARGHFNVFATSRCPATRLRTARRFPNGAAVPASIH